MYKEFDRTAKSYLDVFSGILQINGDKLLHQALFELKMLDVNQFINQINYKYGLNVFMDTQDEQAFINKVLQALDDKDIDFYDVMAQEFIVLTPGDHIITEDEKRNVERIFKLAQKRQNFERMNTYLYPEVDINFNIKYLGIEIAPQMLRKWNNLTHEPAMKDGQFLPTEMLATVPRVIFTTSNGLQANIRSICAQKAEIAQTGILVDIQNAILVTRQKSYNTYNRRVTYQHQNPKNIIEIQSYNPDMDTLFETFTGLDVPSSIVHFDFKNELIRAQGKRFLINNKMIYGEIVIPITSINEQEFTLKGSKNVLTSSLDELRFFFNGKLFDYLKLEKRGNSVLIHFRKTN